ncbi:hypothetical protein GC194_00065 [bacterium]|nr:hypothetical protein [bacterium]
MKKIKAHDFRSLPKAVLKKPSYRRRAAIVQGPNSHYVCSNYMESKMGSSKIFGDLVLFAF